MPRISKKQKAFFNLLDLVYFYEISHTLLSKHDSVYFYEFFLNSINHKLIEYKISDEKRNIYKHYLICALEIYLNNEKDEYEKMIKFLKKDIGMSEESYIKYCNVRADFSLEKLFSFIKEKKLDLDIFIKIFSEVFVEIKEAGYELDYIFNLTVRSFFFDFEKPSLNLYKRIIDYDFFGKNNETDIHFEEDDFLLRLSLLVEFELFRKYMKKIMTFIKLEKIELQFPSDNLSLEGRKQLKDKYFDIVETMFITAENFHKISLPIASKIGSENFNNFFIYSNDLLKRDVFFPGTKARWESMLGSYEILIFRCNGSKTAIYFEESKDTLTLSDQAKIILEDNGIEISARTLYLRYKELKKFYKKVKYYCYLIANTQNVLEWQSGDSSYYDMTIRFDPESVNLKPAHYQFYYESKNRKDKNTDKLIIDSKNIH